MAIDVYTKMGCFGHLDLSKSVFGLAKTTKAIQLCYPLLIHELLRNDLVILRQHLL